MPAKEEQRTASGELVPNAVARVKVAQDQLTRGGYQRTREILMDTFGICARTAASDIKQAYVLIAEDAEAERPQLRAREVQRMTRIADDAEKNGEFTAAIAASARIAKLNGLDVETIMTGTVSPEQQAMLSALVLTPYQRRARAQELRDQLGSVGRLGAGDPAPDSDVDT